MFEIVFDADYDVLVWSDACLHLISGNQESVSGRGNDLFYAAPNSKL